MIIDDFYNWILTLEVPIDCDLDIKQINFDGNTIESTLKKTIVIDVTNNKYIGKFVIWDDNSCFSELTEIDTGKDILHERLDFNNINELKLAYKALERYYL